MMKRRNFLTYLTSMLAVSVSVPLSKRFWVGQPVLAQASGRYLEISRFSGRVTYRGQAAQIGNRLQAGHAVETSQGASLTLTVDNSIGTVLVAERSRLVVQRLEVTSSGGLVTVLDVPYGQARLQARPFTNPSTRLELHTPSGVAAVRGTEFGVSVTETGKTSIGTLEGTVEGSAQGESVQIEAGFASIINPGQPPTLPQPLDRELALDQLILDRRAGQVMIEGQTNPTNTLWVKGQAAEVPISASGHFQVTVHVRHLDSIVLRVVNPLGETREHRFQAWQFEGDLAVD